MATYINTLDALEAMVDDYSQFDEWAFDVETRGTRPPRYKEDKPGLDFRTNEVFWIGFAGPGRTDILPLGHNYGRLLAPAERTKAPYMECPDRRRCLSCDGREPVVTQSGRPSLRQVVHNLAPRFGRAPVQLTHDDVWKRLKPLFFSDARKIGHNVKFDLKSVAKYYGGKAPLPPYGDTQIAAVLANENQGDGQYKLGPCVKREFGFEYEKIGKTVDAVDFEAARYYNSMDVTWTWHLWRRYLRQIEREGVNAVLDLEMDVLQCVVSMEMAGCPIDVEGFRALHDKLDFRLRQIQAELDEAYGGPINLNAAAQVGHLVYDIRGHKCTEFTAKTEERSVARAALEPIAFRNPDKDRLDKRNIKDPIVALLLEYFAEHKVFSTYIANNIADVEADGRIYAEFDQMGARTGRFSSRTPNLQNIPVRRGKEVRDLFIAGPVR